MRPNLPIPMRLRIAETVDGARPSSSASSGPVKRSSRSAAIASTVCSSVRLATTCGAEERSTRPAGPSARQRASHFLALR
jgi:hypothetical protein